MIDTSTQEKEVALLKRLNEKYLDIRIDKGRWGNVKYCSESIVPICDKVHLHHSCGCCDDAALLARPYLQDEELDIPIYGWPTTICVGEKNSCGLGEYAFPGWEKEITQAGYSNEIVDVVKNYFLDNPCVYIKDDDDYY